MKTKHGFGIGRLLSAFIMAAVLAMGILLAPAVQAQASNVGVVNYVAAGTLTNAATWSNVGTPVVIDRQTQVGLSVRFQGNGSATDNIVFTLARSADGVNFETSPPATLKFTNALNNTTAVIGFHQIPREVVGSARALKLVSVVNAATSVSATNAYVGIVKKGEGIP